MRNAHLGLGSVFGHLEDGAGDARSDGTCTRRDERKKDVCKGRERDASRDSEHRAAPRGKRRFARWTIHAQPDR